MTQDSASIVELKPDNTEPSEQVSLNEENIPLHGDIDDTKARLDKYFASGATLSLTWRKRQLKSFYQLLVKEEKRIAEALKADLGKSAEESFLTEIGTLRKETSLFISKLEKWMKPKKVSTPMVAAPAKSMIKSEPFGTCLILGAWNYPFLLTLNPMIAAIAAGNCAIVKPSELSPATSSLMAELVHKYLDMNAVTVIEGGKESSEQLLSLPFNKIFYTGGERVGKIVMRSAAEHLCPVTLELGGKSPCIVDKNIDLKVAMNRIVWGKFMNAGQTCVAPDYLLVHHSNLDSVVDALKSAIVKQYKKDPKKNRFFGRIVNQQHFQRLLGYLDGQQIVHGGEHDIEEKYIAPTVVLNPSFDSPLMQEEIFGPIIPVISFSGRSDMLDFISKRPKPLAAYVFTQDKEFEQKAIENISAGSMCINDTQMFMANAELPFGGVGASGMGSYHGKFGFDTFSHQKTVMRRSFSFENSIRYVPFGRMKMWLIRKLLK